MQNLFAILLVLAFLMNGFHDLIDIPGWTHGRQVRAAIGVKKVVIGTAVNCLIPGIAAAFAIYYWQKPAARSTELLAYLLRTGGYERNRYVVDSIFPWNGSEDQGLVLENVCGNASGSAASWRQSAA